MNEKPVIINGKRMIQVCGYCFPGRIVQYMYEALGQDVQLSHGICKYHKAEMLRQIGETKFTFGK